MEWDCLKANAQTKHFRSPAETNGLQMPEDHQSMYLYNYDLPMAFPVAPVSKIPQPREIEYIANRSSESAGFALKIGFDSELTESQTYE